MSALIARHVLSGIIFLPLLGALALLFWPRRWVRRGYWFALAVSLGTLLLGFYLIAQFRGVTGFEFSEFAVWIGHLGVHYWVGLDGLSVFLVGITLLLTPIVLGLCEKTEQARPTWILVLCIETALLGCFAALDLFLCYFCLELAMLATYFLIRRTSQTARAANLFLGFNLLGSAVLLLCLLRVSHNAGGAFDLASLLAHPLDRRSQLIWGALFLGSLLLKSGLIPFQLWLYRVITDTTPAAFVLIIGVFIKAGAYLAFRFGYPLFPQAFEHYLFVIFMMGLLNVVAAGILVMAKKSIVKKIAFMTMGHMGLVWMGVALLEVDAGQGALFFMISHALVVAILGLVLSGRDASPDRESVMAGDGLVGRAVSVLSSLMLIGLPGTGFFVGLFLVLLPAFTVFPKLTALALVGWVLAAGVVWTAMLTMPISISWQRSIKSWTLFVVLLLLVFGTGFVPGLLLKKTETAMTLWLSKVNPDLQLEREL